MNKFLLLACLLPMSCATLESGEGGETLIKENKEGKKVGRVIYNPHGLKELVDLRRKDALQKLDEYCGTDNYTILKEYDKSRPEYADNSIATAGANELRIVEFECKSEK